MFTTLKDKDGQNENWHLFYTSLFLCDLSTTVALYFTVSVQFCYI